MDWTRTSRTGPGVKDPIERFWSKVEKTDGCWLWRGNVLASGYGQFTIDGRKMRAHRAMWELHFGLIPEGMLVCHHCDTPACVRPDHLFLGTDSQNMADMDSKGRARRPGRRQLDDTVPCPQGHVGDFYRYDNGRCCRICAIEGRS